MKNYRLVLSSCLFRKYVWLVYFLEKFQLSSIICHLTRIFSHPLDSICYDFGGPGSSNEKILVVKILLEGPP